MAKKSNILPTIKLDEYKKKYRHRTFKLLKYTKKDVEAFDKANNTKDFLLQGRYWTLIGDTYYEIPKAPRLTWFRNLNAAAQAGICVLGAGVVATAVAVPLTVINANKPNFYIDPAVEKDASIEIVEKRDDGSVVYKVTAKSSTKVISGIKEVYIGDDKLKETEEYVVEQNNEKSSLKLVILKVAFDNHQGTVRVYPIVEAAPAEKVTITLTASPATGGTVTGGGAVDKGSSVTINAVANDGYTFTGWYNEEETCVYEDAEVTFVASENRTLEAKFIATLPDTYLNLTEEGVLSFKDGGTGAPETLNIESKYLVNTEVIEVDKIGDFTKSTCSSINISEGITEIDGGAFSSNTSITSITIPESIEKIGIGAFANLNESFNSAIFVDFNHEWILKDGGGEPAHNTFTPSEDEPDFNANELKAKSSYLFEKDTSEKADFVVTGVDFPLTIGTEETSSVATITSSTSKELPSNLEIQEEGESELLKIEQGEGEYNNQFSITALNTEGTTKVVITGSGFNKKELDVTVTLSDKTRFFSEYKKAYKRFCLLEDLQYTQNQKDIISFKHGDQAEEVKNRISTINYNSYSEDPLTCTVDFDDKGEPINSIDIGGGEYVYKDAPSKTDRCIQNVISQYEKVGYTFTYDYNPDDDNKIGFSSSNTQNNVFNLYFNKDGYIVSIEKTGDKTIKESIEYSYTKTTTEISLNNYETSGVIKSAPIEGGLVAGKTYTAKIGDLNGVDVFAISVCSEFEGTIKPFTITNYVMKTLDTQISAEEPQNEINSVVDSNRIILNVENGSAKHYSTGSVTLTFKVKQNIAPSKGNLIISTYTENQ